MSGVTKKQSTTKNTFKLAVFSSKKWVSSSFNEVNDRYNFEISYFEPQLNNKTAPLTKGFDAVCIFVNDNVDSEVIDELKANGVKLIALRCAGFNNVDIARAKEVGIGVVRVPAYSPYAVAEHTLGLILALNRKLHRAYSRVRDGNFALDGLLGFDIHNKTIGIIGTGKIGEIFINLLQGFECRILAYDKFPNKELEAKGIKYVDLQTIYSQCDIISLHCPLTYETYHLINDYAIRSMKENVMIVNTSRGKLIDTSAVIEGLKTGKVGYLGLDVYEEEEALFFEDFTEKVIQDDQFVRLQTFPNVLITSHQAFFTKEAVHNISETTFTNIKAYLKTGESENLVLPVKTE
ncbi:MAG: 2-hydroxyacid dehydrogenase [Bacteroidales bacterium]|nr:2-hydroxyacid dehydrogenase [Bacteroidales bacterium]MBN2819926.1 2-hydroxyacid dehydrogenase [Bacteroidales bacterium]